MNKALLGLTILGIGGGIAINQYQNNQKKVAKKSRKKSKAIKKKKKLFCIKDDYYRIADSLWGLDDCLPSQDRKGRAIFRKIKTEKESLYKHLNTNYLWD